MPLPAMGSWAADLYARLGPLTDQDAALGYPLANYVATIGDVYFQEIEDLARDQLGQPGWAAAMDPEQASVNGLPWLGQFVGVRLRSEDTTQAEDVAWVKAEAGFKRGSPAAMIAALKPLLTGTKSVFLNERVGGDAYKLEINLILSEIPVGTRGAVIKAALGQKPAGILLTFNPSIEQTYAHMASVNGTYAIAAATYADYAAMKVG